jgi:hypothetical protein
MDETGIKATIAALLRESKLNTPLIPICTPHGKLGREKKEQESINGSSNHTSRSTLASRRGKNGSFSLSLRCSETKQ